MTPLILILLSILIIYCLSLYFSWLWIHKAYSKGGIYEGTGDIPFFELFFVFLPALNTFNAFFVWFDKHPMANYQSKNKIFNLKKILHFIFQIKKG
jgi:hypothetical protein